MKNLEAAEICYITGSQHLHGEATLNQVEAHSQKIVEELNGSQRLPLKLIFKPTLTRPEEIRALCLEANNAPNCAGLILWMHTFSPSKMWIGGLSALRKPFLHLHTHHRQRSGCGGTARAIAEAARRTCRVEVSARFQDRLRGVDLRRRRSSHGLQLLSDGGVHGGSRGDRRRGVGGD
jgi:hypothetical protein